DSVDCDLGGRDAAQCGCGHGHLGGLRIRRRRLVEQSPLLGDITADGPACLSQGCFDVLPLLGAHGGPPFGWVGLAAYPAPQNRRASTCLPAGQHDHSLWGPSARASSGTGEAGSWVTDPHRVTDAHPVLLPATFRVPLFLRAPDTTHPG